MKLTASMMLALTHPGAVRRLVVADIAPVAYRHDQTRFLGDRHKTPRRHKAKRC